MSARRDLSYAFEIDGSLAQKGMSGTFVIRLEHSVPLGGESALVWLPAPWTLPLLVKAVVSGTGAITASLVKGLKTEMQLPGGSVMVAGASQEGKLLEFRAGRWTTGRLPATAVEAGLDTGSASTYVRRTDKGVEIVVQTRGRIAEAGVNFNVLGFQVDRITSGTYISAYVFSPLAALTIMLLAGISVGVWIVIGYVLFGLR